MSALAPLQRIYDHTDLDNRIKLATFLEISPAQISKKKKTEDIPLKWIYKVSQKYDLSFEWIMTGKGPKRLSEAIVKQQNNLPIVNEINLWLTEIIAQDYKKKDWFEVEFEEKFKMFKEWKDSKDEPENFDYTASNRKIA